MPRGRPTLVCGQAGCGKTLPGIEFLVRGISGHGENGVLLAFEETYEDLVANVAFADLTQLKREQEQLTRASEKAVEASRLKSEFVANISHEIRTSLNGVIGMSGLLLETALTDEQRELGVQHEPSGSYSATRACIETDGPRAEEAGPRALELQQPLLHPVSEVQADRSQISSITDISASPGTRTASA